MDNYIAGFINQIEQAVEIGERAVITPKKKIRNVVVSGLGGSGIGGALVSSVVNDELKVPMLTNNDYFIPGFVNKHTLFIISSYSGNTEETLNAMDLALKAKAQIVCVSSNGKVAELTSANRLDMIKIPGGMPPRACLNLSFIQQLFILNKTGLIGDKVIGQLRLAVENLRENEADIRSKAVKLSEQLNGKIPVIYSETRMEPVAIRFRQQLNENGKMLAWHHTIPEMNHNELVGWRQKNEQLAVIFLRNDDDYYRNVKRIDIVKEVAGKYTSNIIDVNSVGESFLAKCLYLIYLTDWTSFYLAQLNDMDPVEVNVIDYLKGELANI